MGREQRRAQQRAERRQQRQQSKAPAGRPSQGPAISASTASPQERAARRGRGSWLRDIISELRKTTWPSRQEVMNLTVVVIVVSILLGLFLGAADLAFGWFVEQTMLR